MDTDDFDIEGAYRDSLKLQREMMRFLTQLSAKIEVTLQVSMEALVRSGLPAAAVRAKVDSALARAEAAELAALDQFWTQLAKSESLADDPPPDDTEYWDRAPRS